MTAARYDVLGLGNAIVDVITRTDDAFLAAHDMRKGGMSLIDEARAAQIYDAMGPGVEISGGSAANTIVGAAGFGARAAFVGKIKDDQLGAAVHNSAKCCSSVFNQLDSAGARQERSAGACAADSKGIAAGKDLHPAGQYHGAGSTGVDAEG